MNDRLLIACDLHNTLLLSQQAWVDAFVELSGEDKSKIARLLFSKKSRHLIAKDLGLRFEDVYLLYFNKVEPNYKVVRAIEELQEKHDVVLISSASRNRVMNDITKLDNIRFSGIYTKENFCKSEQRDWIALCKQFNSDFIIYFGNDTIEDNIELDFVQTFYCKGD